jgi:hypothetical protein
LDNTAVELRLREKRGRLPQNLVRALQFEVFTLDRLKSARSSVARPARLPGVAFSLPHHQACAACRAGQDIRYRVRSNRRATVSDPLAHHKASATLLSSLSRILHSRLPVAMNGPVTLFAMFVSVLDGW